MTQETNSRHLLVADVGGTNTRVALARGGALQTDTITRYKNASYPGLETVLRTFMEEQGLSNIDGASVAVAGPVRDGRGVMTNLDWSIDREALQRATGAEQTAVLNDLQAQGHALGLIDEDNLQTVAPGPAPVPHSGRLVVGVGTGFNAAPVHDTLQGRFVPPSEAGHANLPIRTEADLRLCHFVETAHGFPAIEDVLSGRGLERVYRWHATEAGVPAERSAAEIMAACSTGEDEIAAECVHTFIRILGTVCGNLALVHLPFGGVYLVGGVARAMAPHFQTFGFVEAFRDKGRFAGFMQNFAVQIVEDDYAALTGLISHLEN